jgi:hypothetical protein
MLLGLQKDFLKNLKVLIKEYQKNNKLKNNKKHRQKWNNKNNRKSFILKIFHN